VRTLVFALLVALLAGLARFGLDRYEQTTDGSGELAVGGDYVATLVEPPRAAVATVSLSSSSDDGTTADIRSTARLGTDDRLVTITSGSSAPVDVRRTAGTVAVRTTDGMWLAQPADSLEPLLFENMGTPWLLTISDVLPPGIEPYLTVVSEATDTIGAADVANATDPMDLVDDTIRTFVVEVDLDRFRREDGIGFATWQRTLGGSAIIDDRIELGVDGDGLVRRLVIGTDGEVLTYELESHETSTAAFDALPVIAAPIEVAPIGGGG
jgi:hypothetical protein